MPTTDPEAIAWLRSRPDSIKALMRQFPPACQVVFTEDAPLCDTHNPARHHVWTVLSYCEDGDIGIGASFAQMDERRHVKPEHIVVCFYQEGQTKEWINAILDGDQS